MKAIYVLIALTLAVFAQPAWSAGQGAVVSQSQVDEETVRRIYMGQSRSLIAVNLQEGDETRARFEQEVLGRNADQLRAHWSRLQFTGRATPLREVADDEAVLRHVRNSEHAVGYVSDANLVGDELHIIVRF